MVLMDWEYGSIHESTIGDPVIALNTGTDFSIIEFDIQLSGFRFNH